MFRTTLLSDQDIQNIKMVLFRLSFSVAIVTMSFRIWTIRSSHKANKAAGGVAALTYRSHWIVHCIEKFFYRDVGWVGL